MKKIVSLVIVFVIVLLLAGCSDSLTRYGSEDKCGESGEWVSTTVTPSNEGYCKYDNYYTQEEVDELVREITDLLYDNYVEYDEFNEILYSNCEIVDGIKHCDIVINLNEDYVSMEEYQDLLDRIETLEGE